MSAGVATGVQFSPPVADRVRSTRWSAPATLYRDAPTMRRLRLNGMRADVSWRGPAKRYAALYQEIAPVSADGAADAA